MEACVDALSFGPGALAIVGNAPEIGAVAAAIDAAEWVVRFNNAPGFGGQAGSRVTHLALVNRGGQMREWLADPDFLERPVVRQARAFILTFPPLAPKHDAGTERICWTHEAVALLRQSGKPIAILSETLHARARRLLTPHTPGRPNPSTGFLVTMASLIDGVSPARKVNVYGFGFDGWPGHPWAAERTWFAGAAAKGQLGLHPTRSHSGSSGEA